MSILADETPDCANLEQMPVAIRFVDANAVIREEIVRFVECDTGTTATASRNQNAHNFNNSSFNVAGNSRIRRIIITRMMKK